MYFNIHVRIIIKLWCYVLLLLSMSKLLIYDIFWFVLYQFLTWLVLYYSLLQNNKCHLLVNGRSIALYRLRSGVFEAKLVRHFLLVSSIPLSGPPTLPVGVKLGTSTHSQIITKSLHSHTLHLIRKVLFVTILLTILFTILLSTIHSHNSQRIIYIRIVRTSTLIIIYFIAITNTRSWQACCQPHTIFCIDGL